MSNISSRVKYHEQLNEKCSHNVFTQEKVYRVPSHVGHKRTPSNRFVAKLRLLTQTEHCTIQG